MLASGLAKLLSLAKLLTLGSNSDPSGLILWRSWEQRCAPRDRILNLYEVLGPNWLHFVQESIRAVRGSDCRAESPAYGICTQRTSDSLP